MCAMVSFQERGCLYSDLFHKACFNNSLTYHTFQTRGKVLDHPKEQHWRVQFHYDVSLIIQDCYGWPQSYQYHHHHRCNLHQEAEFQYSLEHKAVPWSPHVANLHMGHIQVKSTFFFLNIFCFCIFFILECVLLYLYLGWVKTTGKWRCEKIWTGAKAWIWLNTPPGEL